MSPANPAINPPRLASPTKRRSLHSRSPSRSPVRGQAYFDPLLRDLSPTKFLQAFSLPPDESRRNALAQSVESASRSERAVGAKAAQACADLRAWTREMQSWEWPGTFEMPEPARKRVRMSGFSVLSVAESSEGQAADGAEDGGEEAEEYWGSLAKQTVQAYEQRAEEIARDLDDIDVEELKHFVLGAHNQAAVGKASLHDSIGAIGAATDLKRLDDFTALVTATILQALPYLSRLTRLLNTWTARLSILRKTPRYLRDLKQARTDLDHGWAALAVSPKIGHAGSNAPPFSQETMEEMKTVISSQVSSLGRRLDRFLDELEGREEVVPEAWIDDFEELEKQYGEWVVQAGRKVLEGEWRDCRSGSQDEDKGMLEGVEEGEDEDMDAFMDSVARAAGIIPPLEQTRTTQSPSVTTTSKTNGTARSSTHTTTHTTATGPTMTSVTTRSTTDQNAGRQPPAISEPDQLHDTSSARAKHIPIRVSYDGSASNSNNGEPAELPTSINRTPSLLSASNQNSHENIAPTDVKKRAAFLNSDIERSEALNKSKSAPIVRPFEHASNAFTRLFKKNKDRESQNSDQGKESEKEGTMKSAAGNKNDKKPAARRSMGIYADLPMASSSGTPYPLPLSKKQRENEGSVMSGSNDGSSSKGSSSQQAGSKKSKSSKDGQKNMEYMDLARIPSESTHQSVSAGSGSKRSSRQSSTPSKKTKEKDAWSTVYADLFHYGDGRSETSKGSKKSKASGVRMLAPESSGRPKSSSKSRQRRNLSEDSGGGDMMTALPQQRMEAPTSHPREESPKPRASRESNRSNRTETPETYRPSGLHSPFRSPIDLEPEVDQFPDNWPLSADVTPSEERNIDPLDEREVELAPPFDPATQQRSADDSWLDTEDFENLMVSSLPSSPQGKVNTREQDYLDSGSNDPDSPIFSVKPKTDRDWMKSGFSDRSRVLDWNDQATPPARAPPAAPTSPSRGTTMMPRPISVVEEEAETSPEAYPSTSEDELAASTDNAAGYFGNQNSKSTPRNEALRRTKSTPPVSPRVLRVQIPEGSSTEAKDSTTLFRRASATSIESHPRSELKSISVVRRNSMGSTSGVAAASSSAPQTPRDATSPMTYDDTIQFPSPPSIPQRTSSLSVSPESAPRSFEMRSGPSSPISPNDGKSPASRLPKLRKYNDENQKLEAKTLSTPTPLKHGEDNFDRHVSEVLDRVHAPIKFKTRAGSTTPISGGGKSYGGALRPKPDRTGSKNMTLVPADPSPKKSNAADQEVKLYHLTQAGRNEPIKLFVRLVGEGERVMVRVGGGWADLADYLQQYAVHHGSRTVSEGVIELQTAANGSALAKRTFSGPAVSESSTKVLRTPNMTPTLERKETEGNDWLTRPQPEFSMGDTDEDEESSPTVAHVQRDALYGTQRSIPRPTSSSSRPSTAERPSSRHTAFRGDDWSNSPTSLSMVGSSSAAKARGELPEQKARWVEGMLERAKQSASAEKDREQKEKYFGEMGKAGGTRRVVFRNEK